MMAIQDTGLYIKVNTELLRRLNKLVELQKRRGDERANRSQIVRDLIEARLAKDGL